MTICARSSVTSFGGIALSLPPNSMLRNSVGNMSSRRMTQRDLVGAEFLAVR